MVRRRRRFVAARVRRDDDLLARRRSGDTLHHRPRRVLRAQRLRGPRSPRVHGRRVDRGRDRVLSGGGGGGGRHVHAPLDGGLRMGVDHVLLRRGQQVPLCQRSGGVRRGVVVHGGVRVPGQRQQGVRLRGRGAEVQAHQPAAVSAGVAVSTTKVFAEGHDGSPCGTVVAQLLASREASVRRSPDPARTATGRAGRVATGFATGVRSASFFLAEAHGNRTAQPAQRHADRRGFRSSSSARRRGRGRPSPRISVAVPIRVPNGQGLAGSWSSGFSKPPSGRHRAATLRRSGGWSGLRRTRRRRTPRQRRRRLDGDDRRRLRVGRADDGAAPAPASPVLVRLRRTRDPRWARRRRCAYERV